MGERAADGDRGRGARVDVCVQGPVLWAQDQWYTCVFSFKCGVLQCVPLNLDDINVFWNRLRCARGRADARTNEFTVSDDVTRMALWRSRIALETRYPRLRRSNKVVSARYTQYTAGTTRHGPSSSIRVRRATTRSRTSVPRSVEHTAPPRSTPPLAAHAAPWGARQPSCQPSARLPCSSLRAESQQSASAERQGVSV